MRYESNGDFQVPETKEENAAKRADMKIVADIFAKWGLLKAWRDEVTDRHIWLVGQPDRVQLERLADMSRYRNEDGSLR